MSARDRILQRLARGAREGAAQQPRPVHIRPAISEDLEALFCAKLAEASASWESIGDVAALPARVAAYRSSFNLTGVTAVAPALAALAWPQELNVAFGTTDGNAVLAVSQALLGVAETGSLMMVSGPETPTRLNFLPDHELVLLSRTRIVRHIEDAWSYLERMPRVVNLVTGPSRTADVEQTLQLGAHGPRSLHVMLLDSDFSLV
jgi:hypothetical protein